jgi:DNA-binding MarR family transcriptional regulator
MSQNKIPATYIAGAIQSRSYKVLQRYLEESLKEFGLTVNEWKVLGIIESNPFISLSSICSELEVELPYITDLVNKLVDKGLLTKTSSQEDKRSKVLLLSNKAKQVLPQTDESIRKVMRELLFGISIDELKTYLKVLETLIENDKKISQSLY